MLDFLYTAVSWVLLRWHQFFTFVGLDKDSGINWALSIIFLVVTARLLLFRLFIKQVKYQRKMQTLQPKLQEIRNKYKNDRAAMQREMMKLQQEEGFNPLTGCLPLLLQWPIFIGLYHVLRHLANSAELTAPNPKLTLYTFTSDETLSGAKAKLFGAPLAAAVRDSPAQIHLLGGNVDSTRIFIIVLVIFSAAATYTTQRLVRAGQTTIPEGTAATVQRLMLYIIPLGTLGSGLFFPLGVLIYWFANNSWTMLQQLYINKYHPQSAEEKVPAGTVGKTLAPKPGQKPIRQGTRRVPVAPPETPAETPAESAGSDSAPAPPRSSTPRPGQRPSRPGSSRPGGKRPNQAKKRR